MEPVLGGRDDYYWDEPAKQTRQGRNGARPWRTGRRALGVRVMHADAAAMEPVLGGRDDPPSRLAAWRSTCCRNGARPWRTGRPRRSSRPRRSGRGRNGARPWRTGRLATLAVEHVANDAAAMEPVLGGRDDRPEAAIIVRCRHLPQWSPSLADGTTERLTAAPDCVLWPQWSPSLADGTTVRHWRRSDHYAVCRNGARPWRTGRRHCDGPGRAASSCRNGARPWRTGRRPACWQSLA